MSLTTLIFALVHGMDPNISMINPYDTQCVQDTCVVLPLPIFRETTIRLAERNSYSKEIVEYVKLDSARQVRKSLDSAYMVMQETQLKSCDQAVRDVRELSNATSWKQTAKGFGYGLAVGTVLYSAFVIMGTR